MGWLRQFAKTMANTGSDVLDIVSRGAALILILGLLVLLFVWVLSQRNFF